MRLHVLREMFKEHHGLQCGYCTPGMITRSLSTAAGKPYSAEEEVRFGALRVISVDAPVIKILLRQILEAAAKMNGDGRSQRNE